MSQVLKLFRTPAGWIVETAANNRVEGALLLTGSGVIPPDEYTFFSTGQKCTATSRAIVEDSIYDKFVQAVVERTTQLKVGDGMTPGVDIGPAVSEAQLNTDLEYIAIGTKEAGTPLCGREAADRHGSQRRGISRRAFSVPRPSSPTCRTTCGSLRKRSSDRCSRSSGPGTSPTR